MSEHGKGFDAAQRAYDNAEPPDVWYEEEPEIFDSIPARHEKTDVMETWHISLMMCKNIKTGVYAIDFGDYSGFGATKDAALIDLCEQIAEMDQ